MDTSEGDYHHPGGQRRTTLTTVEIRGNGHGNGDIGVTTKTVLIKESRKSYSRPDGVSILMSSLAKAKVDNSLGSAKIR